MAPTPRLDRHGAGCGARRAVRSVQRPRREVMPAGQRGHLGPRVQTARVRADWHRADRLRVSLADERERQGRRTVTVEVREGDERPGGDRRAGPGEDIDDVGRARWRAVTLAYKPALHRAAGPGAEARRRRGAGRRAGRRRLGQEAGVDDVAAAFGRIGVLHRAQQPAACVRAGAIMSPSTAASAVIAVQVETGAGALWHDSGCVRSLPSMTAML